MSWRPAIAALLLALLLAGCAEFPDRPGGSGSDGFRAAPGGVYTVRRGDTLYSIAWRHNLDYRTVARWNDITAPYTIYPGERIRLSPPAAGNAGKAASQPPKQRRASQSSQRPDAEADVPESALNWQWPTRGKVTRGFSADRSGKRGMALAGEAGQAVRAAAAGRVVYSGNGLRGYGNLIIVKHNSRYLTAYGYNRDLLVQEGARVDSGQKIARMGLGPDNTPALHFELRRDGKPVDPASVLPAR